MVNSRDVDLFLIDGIGPFFRGLKQERINWSKIPFALLADVEDEAAHFWTQVEADLKNLVTRARELGFSAITLDDLAHLSPHPWHSERLNRKLERMQARFRKLFDIIKDAGLNIWITADVISLSQEAAERVGPGFEARNAFFYDLTRSFFETFPSVSGLILRIGESDGLDVGGELLSNLHVRSSKDVNRFLKGLLPVIDDLDKEVILRTWTVGAHRIGDLIWHRARLPEALEGIDSERLILSMKPSESDFFRHLPLNQAFFRYEGPKLLELQARREYEGAGEFPSWIGPDVEKMRNELKAAKNMRGISVWCQTGGWHRFKRLTFIEDSALWAELNAQAAIDVFRHDLTAGESVAKRFGRANREAALALLLGTRKIVEQVYYIPAFAEQKIFFRRVRVPPLLHVYWDSVHIHSAVRKVLRHFVQDRENAIQQSETAMKDFPRLVKLSEELDWPTDDIRFMRDTCEMIHLARRYYFSDYSEGLLEEIREAKKDYKKAWPASIRPRYRIKLFLEPAPFRTRTLAVFSKLVLRRQRGYRTVLDRVFTLHLLSLFYRLFKARSQQGLPESMQESAMGIDSLFK